VQIAIATIMRPEGPTGVQTNVNRLKAGLEAKGHDVFLLTPFSFLPWLASLFYAVRPLLLRGALRHCGVFWYRYWHYQFLRLALRRLVRTTNVEVVSAQCPLSAHAALQVRRATNRNFPIVLTCRFNVSQAEEFVEKGELRKPSRLYAGITRLEHDTLAAVDAVVFVSRFSHDLVLRRVGVSRSNTHVIFNGASIPAGVTTMRRSDLGLRENAFVIVSVGTLEPRKNQLTLVRLLTDLLRSAEDCQLALVGDGQDRGKIEKHIREENLADHVMLLGRRRDVQEILPLCDLYCHPAKMESFGVAIAEAMAHGLPVIAAPVGGIPEFVEHERSGLLIECVPERKVEYLEAIRRLMRKDDDYRRLSAGASEVVRDVLSVRAMVAKYEAVYQSLSGRGQIHSPMESTDARPE
jgi:glycosyltransferase involved in cell wall biosynthesis